MKLLLAPTLFALLALAPVGCVGVDSESGDDAAQESEDLLASQGSSTPVSAEPVDDYAKTVKVENGLTITLNSTLAWRNVGGDEQLVLHGTTSENITEVYGFIPDDGFGTATQLGPRSFEIAFDNASDINTVISGNPWYVVATTHTVSGDNAYSAQIYVAPRLVPPAGSTTTARLALGPAVEPVFVSDNPDGVHFRGTVTTNAAPQTLTVTAATNPTLTKDAAHKWHFDWLFGDFVTASQGGAVTAKGKFGATTSTRTGNIEFRISEVSLALGQMPDDIYGFPVCDATVEACIQALPAGTIDYGSCGAFFPVSVCLWQ